MMTFHGPFLAIYPLIVLDELIAKLGTEWQRQFSANKTGVVSVAELKFF